jgi:carbonic anhydrase
LSIRAPDWHRQTALVVIDGPTVGSPEVDPRSLFNYLQVYSSSLTWSYVVVLQHTDCGITRLAGDPAKLAHYFQIQEGELKTKAVAVDVAALRATPALPGAWLISGLVYDVATGLVEIVVPPTPIRTAQNSD